jgi:dihydrofolate reductase
MGRIISNFFISLDGVVESPDQWHFEYFDDEMGDVVGQGFATTKAMLMGRKLYDEWSAYWPEHREDDFGPIINGMPKYVVSSSLDEATWENSILVPGDEAAERLRAAKDETDGDITMSGSATTVRWLLKEGLLDELRLLVHPVAVGHGQRLFEDTELTKLRLVDSRALGSGVLYLAYAPA